MGEAGGRVARLGPVAETVLGLVAAPAHKPKEHFMSSARSRLRRQPVSAGPRSRKTHAACGSHYGRRREVLPNRALPEKRHFGAGKPTVPASGGRVGLG